VRVTARWDRDDPPSVGQQAQLWLGAGSPPHLRAGPA